jgi:hypothetical protein
MQKIIQFCCWLTAVLSFLETAAGTGREVCMEVARTTEDPGWRELLKPGSRALPDTRRTDLGASDFTSRVDLGTQTRPLYRPWDASWTCDNGFMHRFKVRAGAPGQMCHSPTPCDPPTAVRGKAVRMGGRLHL